MTESLLLAVVTFIAGLAFGPTWLKFLRAARVGKQLNPSEGEEQKAKEGTPTMGGVIFLAPIVAVTLALQVARTGRLFLLLPLGLALVLAALGAVDDRQTLVGRDRSAGLPPGAKWAVQIVLCLAVAGALAWYGITQVHVPFVGSFDLPAWAYIPFAAFVLVATTNATAITDGLDSLLGTTAAIAFAAFWIIGLLLGYPLSAGLSATIVGGLLAYLWFNAFPAQVFMGDSGSLPLGGLLGVVALIEREPFLLLPIGIVYVVEALADILQVLTNKLTSKRMFRTAPVHHHFRQPYRADRWVTWPRDAWPEVWVVQRFWIVGAVGALVGLLLAVAS
ncbi:MAG TPA: phospho-N-acetylmuramoyl-pentapeptide-transferase [Chloroflexota bacterium]|nr:phospho-N-acetylmuramoyl-pentapeptide-transferase [Chloroflexota bacterium]